MKTSPFFKLFPPPKFLEMPYAGIDISDSAVHCVMYRHSRRGLRLDRYASRPVPKGAVEAGVIRDEKALVEVLRSLAAELKVTYVKASLPEERMYLFKTEVPDGTAAEIHENIALRLDENVPLAPGDAVFYFDLVRDEDAQGRHMASVSVAPQKVVESYLSVLNAAGLVPMSFELVAKSLCRAIVRDDDTATKLIIQLMEEKTGIYVVDEGSVLFTSTISWSMPESPTAESLEPLHEELRKVYLYWDEYRGRADVSEIIVSGSGAEVLARLLSEGRSGPRASAADVWANAFSYDSYIPPMSREESLGYAAAAGLALPQYR